MRSTGLHSEASACHVPLCRGAGSAPLLRWPPPCEMGAFSLPQGTFLLETAGHHLLSRRGQGRGAFSNPGCAHGQLWDREPSYGFKSDSLFLKVRKYLVLGVFTCLW